MVAVYALKLEDDKRRSLGEAMVRYIATHDARIKKEEIIFERTAEGKPFLQNVPGFHYNISHSGHWLVCATHTEPVGVDIEQVTPLDVLQYREHLSTAEYYALRALPHAQQLAHFYELWTLKESYIKQTGQGLSIRTNSFTMQQSNGEYILQDASGRKQEGIFFKQYNIEDGYKMAICATTSHFEMPRIITMQNVML